MHKPQGDSFESDSSHLMDGQKFNKFYLASGTAFASISWMISQVIVTDSVKEVWDHAETLIAQLEKNLNKVNKIRLRSMTLILDTCLLYLPITRSFLYQSLDYMLPRPSFIPFLFYTQHI